MAQTVTFIIVLALVFVILPVILKKLTGRDFIEILVGRPLFGRREGRSGRDNAGRTQGAGSQTQKSTGDSKKEKNSSKADILQTISDVNAFARRNQYYAIIPGVLKKDDIETKLPAVIVMRSGVVGINMFGYGGSVSARKDDPQWTQTMNGESRQIPSPTAVSAQAEKGLREILRQIGYEEVDVTVLTVFTQKNVVITGPMAPEIIRSKDLIGELGKNRYVRTRDVDVKALGESLAVFQVHSKSRN